MKLGILVLSTHDGRYQYLKRSQNTGWVRKARDAGIPVIFAESDNSGSESYEVDFLEGTLITKGYDSLAGSLHKTIAGLKYMFDQLNCTIVFRTNLSSYLDIQAMNKFITAKQLNDGSYAGVRWNAVIPAEKAYLKNHRLLVHLLRKVPLLHSVEFASGAGYFIGKNVFDNLDITSPLPKVIDDVGIALIGAEKHLSTILIDRVWVDSTTRGAYSRDDKIFSGPLEPFHFRFKSNNRDIDALLLHLFNDNQFREEWLFGVNP